MFLALLLSCAITSGISRDALLPAAAPLEELERPWTLLVYGAADNNADGPILAFLDSVRDALDGDPGMEFVLFLDRSEGFSDDREFLGEDFHGARIYRLGKDSAERLAGGEEFPEITLDGEYESDSADAMELGKFLRFGKKRFPARHYGLMIYSHADGQTMCPDEQSGRSMGIAELTDTVTADESVDFLALELCNMAGIEIAYQWRPGNGGFSADVLVAIPNAGPPLDWDRAFARIRSSGHAAAAASASATLDPATMTAADFGRLVIEEGELGRVEHIRAHPKMEGARYESAGVFDLSATPAVKRAVDAFAVTLASTKAKEAFGELRGPGPRGTTLNYVFDELRGRPYVDLYTLCARAAESETLDADARAQAKQTMEAVDAMVLASFGMDGLSGFEPGKSGIFVVCPDGDAVEGARWTKESAWKACAWYSPLESVEGQYRRWAWCVDGATAGNAKVENWFELLDSWFDSAADGGCNGYAW